MKRKSHKAPSCSLGAFLAQKRIERGLSQLEVAQKLNLTSAQLVSNIERGLAPLPFKRMALMIEALQLDKEELLDFLVNALKNKYNKVTKELRER